jgi:hypothetical protein
MQYNGQFLADRFDGIGTFRSAQFSVENGTFKAGMLHGINTRIVTRPGRRVLIRGEYMQGTCMGELLVQIPIVDWVPDAMAKKCMICATQFGMFSRHHCRACGFVLCGKCSAYKSSMTSAAGTLSDLRVCRVCLEVVAGGCI